MIASLIVGKNTHHAFFIISEVSSMIHDLEPVIVYSLLATFASDGCFGKEKKKGV
jgi:hypothetical protein